MTYLNHAATSWPKPPAVLSAVARGLRAPPTRRAALHEEAKRAVCARLGIDEPARFLFTSGGTHALALVLDALPWRRGDAIITSGLEHDALLRPVERLCAARGVTHWVSPYAPGQPVCLGRVRERLAVGDVRLVAFTHASNVTGEVLPAAELSTLAREHGALCLLDAAQTVGVLPLDVARLGVDVLAFAGHKGALGPQGVGGLWTGPRARFRPRGEADLTDRLGFCDVGSVNLAGALGLAAGLQVATEEQVGDAARSLAAALRRALSARGCRVLGGDAAPHSGALSATWPGLTPAHVQARLARHGVTVQAGSHCAPQALRTLGAEGGTVRFSFGYGSTEDDLVATLRALAAG